jgi:hypothetical protein
MTPDTINGLFEFAGGFMLLRNALQLYRDKQVKGVHWMPTLFFTSWGVWNLYYYPSLDQWFSFAGGVFLVLTNALWLGQIFYYGKRRIQT